MKIVDDPKTVKNRCVGVAVDNSTLKRRKEIIKKLRKISPDFRIQPLERQRLLEFYEDLEDVIRKKSGKAVPENHP